MEPNAEPELMIWGDIKSQTLDQLSHPGASRMFWEFNG